MKSPLAWITWERQQRNLSMAKLFLADYYEFNSSIKNRLFRSILNSIKTISVFKKKYRVIFVQNPSMILTALAATLKLFYRSQLVVDAHNAGVFPCNGRFKFIEKINLFILRRADMVIVSNRYLVNHLKNEGVRALAMPDPLPDIPPDQGVCKSVPIVDVFIICSWSDDEPVELYLELPKSFPEVSFAISGDFERKFSNPSIKTEDNVSLLGFIEECDYFSVLTHAKVIIDLTTRENCLVCGAYESVSANVPLIVTESPVNREVFSKGAVFAYCNIDSLCVALRYALHNQAKLKRELASLKLMLGELQNKNKQIVLSSVVEKKR